MIKTQLNISLQKKKNSMMLPETCPATPGIQKFSGSGTAKKFAGPG